MSQLNETSRRDFLAVAGTAAAAASFASGVYADGKDVIKVGLIGCGGRGSGAAKDSLMADKSIQLVAVGDVFENRVKGTVNNLSKNKEIGERVKVTPETTFVGLDAYKKVIDAGVDLVILATPPGFRPTHLEAAVAAGKHVFTEKPVCVDGPGARKCMAVYEEALKKKLVIVAGTQRRHQQGYIDTIKQIRDGAIGEIVTARCSWNNSGIWFRKREPGFTDVAYQLHNWYHFLWTCGDHICEQHVHNLDVINWAMNGHPVKATGYGSRTLRPGGPMGDPNEFGNIFDQFAIEYEYANGVRMYSFCRHIPGADDVSETLFGTKGVCKVNQYNINGKGVAKDKDISPYVQEHIDLIKALRSGEPLNELKTVTESSLTAVLGRMSAYTGQRITWEQALGSQEDTMPKNLTWDTKLSVAPAPVPGKTKFV
jgi:predicted dehydrogenase